MALAWTVLHVQKCPHPCHALTTPHTYGLYNLGWKLPVYMLPTVLHCGVHVDLGFDFNTARIVYTYSFIFYLENTSEISTVQVLYLTTTPSFLPLYYTTSVGICVYYIYELA